MAALRDFLTGENMLIDQDEIHAMLFSLTLECARPSWRFRALFSAQERQLLGFAINTFMGQRQHNQLMNELDRRYGANRGNPGEATQAGASA
jgi:hypothetical protein